MAWSYSLYYKKRAKYPIPKIYTILKKEHFSKSSANIRKYKYKVHKSQEARDHARKLYKEAFGRSTWNEDAQQIAEMTDSATQQSESNDILLDIKEKEEQSEDQQEEDSDLLEYLPVVIEY